MNIKYPLQSLAVCLIGLFMVACSSTGERVSQSPSYFISVQDGRAGLENGSGVVRSAEDSLAVVEMTEGRLRLVHSLAMPTSLVGPPSSIAIAPGGKMALVTATTRRDPRDVNKVLAHDGVSVVALDSSGQAAPKVIAEIATGTGASGVSINKSGNLALVANRVEGTISVLSIEGMRVQSIGKVTLASGADPAHVAFTPDGSRALVTRGDNRISMLDIKGSSVTLNARELSAGIRPYGLDISPSGQWGVVTNLGMNQGDADTISLINLEANPPRVVDTVSVGQTPEGIFFSPDGKLIGLTVIDGSNKPKASPFYGSASYQQYEIKDGRLMRSAEIKAGA